MSFAISWSRLERFEQCPLKSYWMDFAPKHAKIKQGFSPILEKGKQWHSHMERGLKTRKPLPEEVAAFQPMVNAILAAPGNLLVEHQLALTERYQKCNWFSSNAYWRTVYDVIVVADTATSIDWKTGKVKDQVSDQLKFSAASAMLAWPKIKTIKNYYAWLEHPHVPLSPVTIERTQLPAIMTEFEERAEAVKIAVEQEMWEAKPSGLCRFCPCTKAHCKYAEK